MVSCRRRKLDRYYLRHIQGHREHQLHHTCQYNKQDPIRHDIHWHPHSGGLENKGPPCQTGGEVSRRTKEDKGTTIENKGEAGETVLPFVIHPQGSRLITRTFDPSNPFPFVKVHELTVQNPQRVSQLNKGWIAYSGPIKGLVGDGFDLLRKG
jgi:hypothetical protein